MGKASKTASRSNTTKDASASNSDGVAKSSASSSSTSNAKKVDVILSDHLPPIFLVLTVMASSGFLLVYSFRDVFATGRNIGGDYDEAYLVCNSTFVWLEFVVITSCCNCNVIIVRATNTYRYMPCLVDKNNTNRLLRIRYLFSTTRKAGNPNRVV